jgi:modulator of drug activity B
MNVLIINTHLTYAGWSEGKLNLTFMNLAKTFFVERGHEVAETFVERGYDPEEEVKKHVAADLVILQTPVNWFSAQWIYKKYVDEVFNVGLANKVPSGGRTRREWIGSRRVRRARVLPSWSTRKARCPLKLRTCRGVSRPGAG